MTAIQNISIHFPGKLVFGNGSLDQLGDELLQYAPEKILVVTIEPLLPKLKGLIQQLEAAGATVRTDTSIVQEPGFGDFKNLMQQLDSFNADMVVGVGGGSVLDVAMLVAAQL